MGRQTPCSSSIFTLDKWPCRRHQQNSPIYTGMCYVPISQVNSVSVSVHPVTFLQMQTVVRDLTKCTPPCFPLDFTSRWVPHKSVSVVTSHLGPSYVNGLRHYTTLPYGLGILGLASHGVTTQMTYFTTCLFHLPHGTSVLLFLYLTRLVSLVTYLFHLTLFKHRVLVCLSQFEISS